MGVHLSLGYAMLAGPPDAIENWHFEERELFGSNELPKWLAWITVVIYAVLTVTILINLLIAQMSKTFGDVNNEFERRWCVLYFEMHEEFHFWYACMYTTFS